MAEQPFLKALKEGEAFTGFLLAQEAAYKVSAKGSEYLELKLSDASGDIKAFLWDVRAVEGDPDRIAADAFLWVKGSAGAYNGRPQLRLDKVRHAEDSEVGDFGRFFPVSARPVAEMLAKDPAAVILSGGPSSVYAEGAPQVDPALFGTGVPTFGICYGFQAMAQALGGTVAHTGTSEYGRTELKTVGGELHSGLPGTQPVWMSHNDAVQVAPEGFTVTGSTPGAPVAAFECVERKMAGVQYHPEVLHSPHGQEVLTFQGPHRQAVGITVADQLAGVLVQASDAGVVAAPRQGQRQAAIGEELDL